MSWRDLHANSGPLSRLPGRTGATFQETSKAGEVTAVRRMTVKALSGAAAALMLAVASPATAQNSDTPVDVTAAPPPSAETVGPSQLRDFTLRGTVTRPADRPATTQPAPSAQPRTAAPAPTTVTPGTESTNTQRASAELPSGRDLSAPRPARTAPQIPPGADSVTPAPASVRTGSIPPPSFDDTDPAATAPAPGGGLPWSWIAALLALVGGGAFIAWSRRNRRQRYGDPGRMAFAGLVTDMDPKPAPPPVRPRPDPTPPRAAPTPPRAAPSPPAPAGVRPAPKPAPAGNGLIVSTRLKPEITLHFQPDRAVVTETDVMLQFDVVVINSGSAPARDLLVEARMVCAHAGQDAEIAAFFQQPIGKGDRIAVIQPLGRISLKSAVRLPLDQLHSFQVEGRTLFVPLVAFNLLYSGDAQTSASFLVGRGTEQDEKLAPFRLDLGPRIFRGLSSRPHSMGLSR